MLAGAVYFLVVADVGAAVLEPVAWLGPLAFNRAVHAGFGDRARPAWADAVLALISLACGAVWTRGFDVLALLLFAEAPLRVMTGAGDDLVAWRRLARRWFLGFGGLLACAVSLAVLLGAGSMAAQSAAVGAILLCLAAAGRPWPVELALAAHASPPAGLDAQEVQQLARLRRLMQEEQAFRDPQLTLSLLSRRLELPEHRLRRLIHLGEAQGHFNAYLNGLRIAAVKAALADPARGAETLLTLATEAGYNSLSAFNRAFKMSEGCTPSAWRTARQASSAPSMLKPAETPNDT